MLKTPDQLFELVYILLIAPWIPFQEVINGRCHWWHLLFWVTNQSSAQNCSATNFHMQMFPMWTHCYSLIQTCAMMKVWKAHIPWMRTMNMHNPVLMQWWKQFGKMMIMMNFVGGANSYKTTDGKVVFLTQAESYHHCGPAFAHYSQLNLSALSNFKKKSNFNKKQNWQTNLPKIMVVNEDQHFPWK